MKNRFVALLLLLALVLTNISGASAQTTSQKEESFKKALSELEDYLGSAEEDTVRLAGIASVLEELGNYKQIGSSLLYYVECLIMIAEEDYTPVLDTYLISIANNTKFNEFLSRDDFSLGSVEQLKQYAKARKLEYEGNKQAASEAYYACEGFFDSTDRQIRLGGSNQKETFEQAMKLLRAGDLEGAYWLFKSIQGYGESETMLKSIVIQLGYTPTSEKRTQLTREQAAAEEALPELTLDAKPFEGWITLSWNKIPNVKKLTIYRTHLKSGDERTFEMEKDADSYKDGTVYFGAYYYYTIEAVLKNGKTVRSNTIKIQAASAAKVEKIEDPEGGGSHVEEAR